MDRGFLARCLQSCHIGKSNAYGAAVTADAKESMRALIALYKGKKSMLRGQEDTYS